MRTLAATVSATVLFVLVSCTPKMPPEPVSVDMPLSVLQDKIKGGWAGQMIGVSWGAPTEFHHLGAIMPEEEMPVWAPEMIEGALTQDDIYVDVTFSEVLDQKGMDATTADFGEMLKNSRYELWHANLAARRNLRRGIPAEESGLPNRNAHANDIDFQIESDFIGLMAPGMPQATTEYCWRVGRIMNYGDGIYGGIFISGMYAAAFFESDPVKLVEAGLACLPPESPYAQVIADTLKWSRENPTDWTRTWQLIEDKWDKRDPCPQGALSEFNIDAKLNGAYVALGLLYGGGDFERTIVIATRAGQDSDCNPATAAGVLGVALGFSGIPERFTQAIPPVADRKFAFTNHSLNTLVESTMQHAIDLTQRNGGQFMGDSLTILRQQPAATVLETWDDYGAPAERIAIGDERWTWSGQWNNYRGSGSGMKRSATKGAETKVTFNGTGFILRGTYSRSGGIAEISVDGEPAVAIDTYMEGGERDAESLFHRFDLAAGQHTVHLTVSGKPYERSREEEKGRSVVVSDLVVFRK